MKVYLKGGNTIPVTDELGMRIIEDIMKLDLGNVLSCAFLHYTVGDEDILFNVVDISSIK